MTGQRFHYSPLPPLPPAEQAPLLEVRNLSRGEKYRNVNLALRGGGSSRSSACSAPAAPNCASACSA